MYVYLRYIVLSVTSFVDVEWIMKINAIHNLRFFHLAYDTFPSFFILMYFLNDERIRLRARRRANNKRNGSDFHYRCFCDKYCVRSRDCKQWFQQCTFDFYCYCFWITKLVFFLQQIFFFFAFFFFNSSLFFNK